MRWRLVNADGFLRNGLGLSVYLFVVIPKGFFPQQDVGLISATSEASVRTFPFAAMKDRGRKPSGKPSCRPIPISRPSR